MRRPDFSTFRSRPPYMVQKALAIQLWMLEYGIARRVHVPVCAVCSVMHRACRAVATPDAHHLIIPRNRTRNKKKTVNWFWNLIPVHAFCHPAAHAYARRAELIAEQVRLLGKYVLDEPVVPYDAGLDWLREQIELEGLRVSVELPLL